MRFTSLPLSGAYVIDLDLLDDERGFFARSWSRGEAAALGLLADLPECSISFNRFAGTVRGLHYQVEPYQETKLVRCTAGAIYDVALDLRPDSKTFRQWAAVELTAENRRLLYLPAGFAHGFQTLRDATEVFYQISAEYAPTQARGVRWNDPTLQIAWPLPVRVISERDRQLSLLTQ